MTIPQVAIVRRDRLDDGRSILPWPVARGRDRLPGPGAPASSACRSSLTSP